MESKKTPVVAKQPEKGDVVPTSTVEVDATTGWPKELIRNGKVSGPEIKDPTVTEKVTFEDKVVAPK